MLSLAFAMHSNRGVYALLLGSGISRAAAIPTGWEVVIDLIRRLAVLKGVSCEPDPEAWFCDEFSEEPTYSGLLKKLCRTPAERQQLLRSYFEPSSSDSDSKQKQPTKAHEAIAALAKSGHIRVILTTNFDRLLERSLEAAGVSPVLISTPSAVDGATPLTHAPCTVVKLHGDYLDARIKNTPDELAKYDRRIDRLLDRVFDEFGLIVSGWSADWDEALVRALTRCKSSRFTTYWTLRGKPSDAAQRLIDLRRADAVSTVGADEFFHELREKVLSLAAFDAPHPLSSKTAVATMKRYLVEDRYRIQLDELVRGEVERVMAATSAEKMPVSGSRDWVADVRLRLGQYEAATGIVRDLFITAARWASPAQTQLLIEAIERLGNLPQTGGVTVLINLRLYPAVLVLYAGGIAAVASGNLRALRMLLLGPKLRSDPADDLQRPAVQELYPQAVLDRRDGSAVLTPNQDTYTPLNNHLFQILREPLREAVPSDDVYADVFDLFEYLFALVYVDSYGRMDSELGFFPVGRFGWRSRFRQTPLVVERLTKEADAAGEQWVGLSVGLFSSLARFKAAEATVAKTFQGRG